MTSSTEKIAAPPSHTTVSENDNNVEKNNINEYEQPSSNTKQDIESRFSSDEQQPQKDQLLKDNQQESYLQYNEDGTPKYIRVKWNSSPSVILKLVSAYYGFIVFGMFDSSLGALVPHLETSYNVSYTIVALAFLTPFVGYLISAFLSDYMHRLLGRRGVTILGISLELTCFIVCLTKPPFYGFVIAYAVGGFGNGCIEATWNSLVGSMQHANQLMGLLHGCYGLGGIINPTVETAIIAQGHDWNITYSVMVAMCSLSLCLAVLAYRHDSAQVYRLEVLRLNAEETDDDVEDKEFTDVTKVVLRNKLVWLLAFVLLCYVGGEVAYGGWLTTFMIEVRHGSEDKMGYVTTGYWTGLTVGRVFLGFAVGLLKKEELFALIYMVGALTCMLIIWLVPNLYVSAVFAAFFGFLIGPIYPTVMVVAMKKLPKRLHVSAVGFSAAFGGIGAAILPFVNGVITNKYGPTSLAPLIVALFGSIIIFWLVILKFF